MQGKLKEAQRQAAEQMLPYRATVQKIKELEAGIKEDADALKDFDQRLKFEETQLPVTGSNADERKKNLAEAIANSLPIQELRKQRFKRELELDKKKVELNAQLRTHSLDKKEISLMIGLLESPERGELVTDYIPETPIAPTADNSPIDILD